MMIDNEDIIRDNADIRINPDLTVNGINADMISTLITRHQKTHERYMNLINYYRGKHIILKREKLSEASANNKLVSNHAKYITDMTTAFFNGVPVEYLASEGYDIEPLKNSYLEQTISALDTKLAKNSSICGRAYELIYANNNSQPRSAFIEPINGFIVYDDSAEHNKLFGVYYYNHLNINGGKGNSEVLAVDDRTRMTFKGTTSSFNNLILSKSEPHYFGGVPMVEYLNNDEAQGDFEQVISIIDAYNIVMSDRVNDKEQFVDAILFLTGVLISENTARKLKEERILEAEPDAKAEYLSKSLTEADIEILRKALKEDIQRFSMVPDLSDEQFAGNLSGVAIQYKLLGFQQHVKNKEPLFSKGLRERFELYNNFLKRKRKMSVVPPHRVDIKFSRNLPSNDLEISQVVNNLKNTVSDETLLSIVPCVTDAKEERKLMVQQKIDEIKQRITEENMRLSATGFDDNKSKIDEIEEADDE